MSDVLLSGVSGVEDVDKLNESSGILLGVVEGLRDKNELLKDFGGALDCGGGSQEEVSSDCLSSVDASVLNGFDRLADGNVDMIDSDVGRIDTIMISKVDNPTYFVKEIIDIDRFSTLNKLLSTIAYVLRFIHNLKSKVKGTQVIMDETITLDERKCTMDLWITSEQDELKKRPDFSKLKSSLKLFVDDATCYRLRGRFGNSMLERDKKYPLILRGIESSFTKLLIEDSHYKVYHHGVETTLAYIRERFWILRGRRTVKSVLYKCVICKRYQRKALTSPPTTDLPVFRVHGRSFVNVGLDYAGPLYIKDRDLTPKVYVLLFTCATSRAIHLEPTPDMENLVLYVPYNDSLLEKENRR